MNKKTNGNAHPKKGFTKKGKRIGCPPGGWPKKNVNGDPFPVIKLGDIELLSLEKGITPKRIIGYTETEEFKRVKQLLMAMQPRESFVIKKEWSQWPVKIIRETQLPVVIRVGKIEGNQNVKRVYRIK